MGEPPQDADAWHEPHVVSDDDEDDDAAQRDDSMRATGDMWLRYLLRKLWDQCCAVLPVAAFLIGFRYAVQRRAPPLATLGGVSAVVFGITLFLEGFEFGIMPLGEVLGLGLPRKLSRAGALATTFVLGLACTLAEPALGALSLAGSGIDHRSAPILWLLLNEYADALVVAIGLGVGVAALVGTARLLRGWAVKPVIVVTTLFTLGMTAAAAQFGAGEVVALAWDTGAVTTGVVTVPIVLGLGVGIKSAMDDVARERRQAAEAELEAEEGRRRRHRPALASIDTNGGGGGGGGGGRARAASGGEAAEAGGGASTGGELDGFGIVTLASLFPVCCVLALGIGCAQRFDAADVAAMHAAREAAKAAGDTGWLYRSPVREVVYAVRAIVPLIALLVVLIRKALGEELPTSMLTLYSWPAASTVGEEPPSPLSPRQRQQQQSGGGATPRPAGADGGEVTGTPLHGGAGGRARSATETPLQLGQGGEEEGGGRVAGGAAAGGAIAPGARVTIRGLTGSSAVQELNGDVGVVVSVPAGNAPSDRSARAAVDLGHGRVVNIRLANLVPTPPGLRVVDPPSRQNSLEQQQQQQQQQRPLPPPPPPPLPQQEEEEHLRIRVHPLSAVGVAFVGLVFFNLGLRYGLGPLGDSVGSVVPALFTKVPDSPGSPVFHDRSTGLACAVVFTFFLGLAATLSEPALNAMGATTEKLTHGKFTKRRMISSVAMGVAGGVMLATLRMMHDGHSKPLPARAGGVAPPPDADAAWSLEHMLYYSYGVCLLLTAFSSEEFVSVAWDSAGVTTGSITVPLVLALGLGLGGQLHLPDAFGLLTMASVGPIFSVLVVGLGVRFGHWRGARAQLQRNPSSPGISMMELSREYATVPGGTSGDLISASSAIKYEDI